MPEADVEKIADLVRGVEPSPSEVVPGLSLDLILHVQHLLFDARAIAPAEALIYKVAEFAKVEFRDPANSADRVVALFDEHVRRMIDDFAQKPETWGDPLSLAFVQTLGACLGIEEQDVPKAIRLFHGCTEGQRMGIFIKLESSRLFGYLTKEIDDCQDSVDVQHPEKSLRGLLRLVWA